MRSNEANAGFLYKGAEVRPLHQLQVLTDYFAEDADVAFGIPEDSLLEVGLPYRLH